MLPLLKKKNIKIRANADFSMRLNDDLPTYYNPLKSPGAIFAKLSGGKLFSKLDLSGAFLRIPIDEECAIYLTITTLKGMFRFNRLPFGIKVTPDIFQQIMDTLLNVVDFVIAYMNFILIKSESRE